ncbi:MAG: CRISPR-associated endonuclease Cas3'' [Candidatus Riflebacteria bacterium]|nr:CRISPR-associated endonuclease Cas3'' [Candidatus Riflebacteria bacterium]
MRELLARPGQELYDHLMQVGDRAAGFAAAFDAVSFALLAGQLHDLGKAESEFQKRIHTDDREGLKEPHAHHGAALALSQTPPIWPVALAINGHHAGLHNRGDVDAKRGRYLQPALNCLSRLSEGSSELPLVFPSALPKWLAALPFDSRRMSEGWLAVDLFTRFLFSALIDADRLDSEECERGRDASLACRRWPEFKPEELLGTLRTVLDRRSESARTELTASEVVQDVRNEVGRLCLEAASSPRGVQTLTVPTGGGKTLASVLFALAHAAHHGRTDPGARPFRRIILVIPYLNIIQQTAQELRTIFGDEWILEHHSQAEERDRDSLKKELDDDQADALTIRRRLAAENWDAPIIVTTSAQFFGSLFSRRPSAARKLHNICQSVVIFDEVQTLPPLLLQPLLNVLGELASSSRPYGCSLVFCTATQPALNISDDLPCGLKDVKPIVPPAVAVDHFVKLSRVDYCWPEDAERLTWDDLAAQVVSLRPDQTLVIVNTRQSARHLHAAVERALGGSRDGLFHLSTWMTPAHRLEVLDEVRRRLAFANVKHGRERCILVSTQCIEAGVDVDFPHVWREFAPYDAIVQAAGRCNRNGLLPILSDDPKRGQVRVFRGAQAKLPDGLYRAAVSQTELLRRMHLGDPTDPRSFEKYFRLLYQLSVPDECLVQRERAQLRFAQVDDRFKFIDDESFSALVLRQKIDDRSQETPAFEILRRAQGRKFFIREDWRLFQPYIVNLPWHARARSPYKESLSPTFDTDQGMFLWTGGYSGGLSGTGITFEGLSPEEGIV